MNIDKCVCVYVWRHMVVTSDAIWSVNMYIYIYICWGGFMATHGRQKGAQECQKGASWAQGQRDAICR